jgi:signal transduction histidine kinase
LDGPLGRFILSRRRPILIPDVTADTALATAFRETVESSHQMAEAVRSWLAVPLIVREKVIGLLALYHTEPNYYSERQGEFVLAFANQAAITLENAQLYDQARRLAVLEERQRLARELHDSVSQALYGIGLGARTARELLDRDPDQAAGPLDYVLSLAEAGLAEMRSLIFELRPDSLEKEGLVAALEKQTAALRARHDITVHTDCDEEPLLPFPAKEALYRIAVEALNNTVKHARASRVELSLEQTEAGVHLRIRDDGIGFDPAGEYPGHFGLDSMRERALHLGGNVTIESEPGQGTTVDAFVPDAGGR